jgi:LssY C-terminus
MTTYLLESILPRRLRRLVTRALLLLALFTITWLVLAYVVVPAMWRRSATHHPALEGAPCISHTKDGIPGDPLNIAIVASEDELAKAMLAAGWDAADPITLKTSLRIAGGTVLRRPYVDAPVSNLYVWNRNQDLAFERPVGHDPRQRHHVRLWRSKELDDQGRPLWFGAATFDVRVGFSLRTGQITHHIHADVDAERDKLLDDLHAAKALAEVRWIEEFNPQRFGRNGGGDRYYTDGRLPVAVIAVPE